MRLLFIILMVNIVYAVRLDIIASCRRNKDGNKYIYRYIACDNVTNSDTILLTCIGRGIFTDTHSKSIINKGAEKLISLDWLNSPAHFTETEGIYHSHEFILGADTQGIYKCVAPYDKMNITSQGIHIYPVNETEEYVIDFNRHLIT